MYFVSNEAAVLPALVSVFDPEVFRRTAKAIDTVDRSQRRHLLTIGLRASFTAVIFDRRSIGAAANRLTFAICRLLLYALEDQSLSGRRPESTHWAQR